MQSTSYAVPAGHALRLALSPTYWPWIWPSPEPVTLTAARRDGSSCRCAGRRRSTRRCRRSARPRRAPGMAKEYVRAGRRSAGSSTATSRRARRTSSSRGSTTATRCHRERDAARRAQRRPLPADRGRPAVGRRSTCEVEVELGARRLGPHARRRRGRDDEHARRLPPHHAARRLRGRVRRVRARAWTHAIPRDGG